MTESQNFKLFLPGNILKATISNIVHPYLFRIIKKYEGKELIETNYEISFLPIKGKPDSSKNFIVRASDLMPLPIITDRILLEMGFDKVDNRFIMNDVVIRRIEILSNSQDNGSQSKKHLLELWPYCVIESTHSECEIEDGECYINDDYELKYKGDGSPSNEKLEKLRNTLIPVTHVHILQNYWKKRFESDLNVDNITFS